MATNRLHEIEALGQAIWLDDLSRELIDNGGLQHLVDKDGLTGVTSNPTIFDKAISDSERYDDALAEGVRAGLDARDIFFRLALDDVRDACDLLAPVFERTQGRDGYVSFELPPELAHDAAGSIETAKRLRDEIGKPNALIKVPGTTAGVEAFHELTAAGVSVNVTLLFAVNRYEEIAEAYLQGLERLVDAGEPVARIASVASFFVSRVDTAIDEELERLRHTELAGKAGVANARLAYQAFERIFSGQRWARLREHGANVQRPLWASTSTKNPAYPDTLYVDGLIGPQTVNTMPDATIQVARDHATPRRTVDRDYDEARAHMAALREAGVDVEDIVLRRLVEQGVDAFAQSFDSLIQTIQDKAKRLRHHARAHA